MIRGRILDLREDGTAVIEAPVDVGQFIHRKVSEVYIDTIDSRPLSDRQRRNFSGSIIWTAASSATRRYSNYTG